MQEHEPGQVELARAERGHLPVEHGDGLEVLVHHVADACVAPAEHVGPAVGGPVLLQPGQAALDDRDPAAVVVQGPVVVGGAGRRRGAAASLRRTRGRGRRTRVSAWSRSRAGRRGPRCSARCSRALLLRGRRRAASRRTRRAGCPSATRPSIWSITKNGVPSGAAVRLVPAEPRDRDAAALRRPGAMTSNWAAGRSWGRPGRRCPRGPAGPRRRRAWRAPLAEPGRLEQHGRAGQAVAAGSGSRSPRGPAGCPGGQASQFSRAVPSEPMLRSLTVILTRSPGARSSADAVMGCLRAAVR